MMLLAVVFVTFCITVDKVSGSDKQLVGIKRDFTLGGAMLVYQLDKPLEQLFLPADTFGTFHEKQAMSLVVDIQQETLDIILSRFAGGNSCPGRDKGLQCPKQAR